MLKALFIAVFMLSSLSVYSQEIDGEQFISSVEVTEVEAQPRMFELTPGNPIDEVAMYIDSIIAIGKKIWPIIEAGRPVITTTGIMPSISVLPRLEGAADPKAPLYEMANWSLPKSKSYRVSYKNKFGSEVIGFTYTVYFQFNGSYKGVGKYVTNLAVQASEVYTSWGFNFDASSELVGISNVGTDESPVSAAIIRISYKGKGFLNEVRNSQSFYVDGNGEMQVTNN